MDLNEFLNERDIKPLDFAKLIGVKGKATIYRYLNGTSIPGPSTMDRIYEVTEGLVTANDFHNKRRNYDAA